MPLSQFYIPQTLEAVLIVLGMFKVIWLGHMYPDRHSRLLIIPGKDSL